MHTAGKVFSVFSTLLAIVFLFLTASIVNYRIEKRREIDAAKARVPQIQKEMAELDVQRSELRAENDRLTRRVTQVTTAGLNEQEILDGRITILTDLVNDAAAKLKTWSASLAEVQAENESRAQEIDSLNATIAQSEKLKEDLTKENADLTQKLANARKVVEETMAQIKQHYEQVQKLSEEKKSETPSDRIAGANR